MPLAKSTVDFDFNQHLKTEPIAIVGMSSIFPKAKNLQEFWDNILAKIDCVTDVPPDRWNVDDYYDPDPSAEDKTYCKRGGFIPEIDFDPTEFGLPPNILEVTDVSQLLGLVVARDALEDAGYGEGVAFPREYTGVILGVVGMATKLFTPLMARLQYPVWEKVLRSSGVPEETIKKIIAKIKQNYVGWEENSFPGTIGNVIAGRIANRFDLGGTNCVVDAACASSLAAVKMAIAELIEGRAYMMLTGGVDTDNSINTYMCFSKTPAFAKSESVRPFDQDSNGMMVGEGLGILVLKRLKDAEKDQDRIYAVIKAIGSSSDGRFKSIYAPRPEGQAKALRRAYKEAGFAPQTVGLIEAHGTGTMAGDPAEFQGLNLVFSENNPEKQTIGLGSVKSQIAHTKSTAGAASLIKVALALHHKVLPATINVTKPNPKLNLESTPFYLNTETRPWIRPASGLPRRAGVSSFGFGGTNFHVVLEEYKTEHNSSYRLNLVCQTILLAAGSPAELVQRLKVEISTAETTPLKHWFDTLVENSAALEIPDSNARIGILAKSPADALQSIKTAINYMNEKGDVDAWEHPSSIFYRKNGLDHQGKVVALFPGQGSQYVEMGRELLVNFPDLRKVFSALDEIAEKNNPNRISPSVYPIPVFDSKLKDRQTETLQKTENAQPAIGALSMGILKLFRKAGLEINFSAGHSFGEITALWAAEVLSDDDFLELSLARGKAMQSPDDPNFDAGGMLAVKASGEKVKEEIGGRQDVVLANWNSNQQVVLAGAKKVMTEVQELLSSKGYSVVPLPVSAAFHTPLVGHAHKPFKSAIGKKTFNQPKIKVFSNSTGKEYPSQPDQIKKILSDHILNPVLFRDEVLAIYDQGGRIFIEFGPKGVLTGLVGNILAEKPHIAIAINGNSKKDSDIQLREAYLKLRVLGIGLGPIDPYTYKVGEVEAKKKPGMVVKLTGGLYLSEKTRQRQKESLVFENLFIQNPVSQPLVPGYTLESARSNDISGLITLQNTPDEEEDMALKSAVSYQEMDQLLSVFQSNQSELARIHSQFLANDIEYSRIFSQLSQMELGLMSKEGSSGQSEPYVKVIENISRSMERFHDHQNETLKVHEAFVRQQQEILSGLIGILSSNSIVNTTKIEKRVRPEPAQITNSVLSQKTAVLPAKVQALPTIEQADRSEIKTPIKQELEKNISPIAVIEPSVSSQETRTNGSVSDKEMSEVLLRVVSEKTGYPQDMIDLDMDMEADLGIDSIKRVEILGAVQDHFPALPKPDPESLAEMRTLSQIIQNMSKGSTTVIKEVEPSESKPLVDIAVITEETNQASSEIINDTSIINQLTPALLGVVSEKTGYPQDMLDLDMDMEADLGIDSIKRVEILGAMQELFPKLPKPEPEALAEMRTLRQIVEHLGSLAGHETGGEPVKKNDIAHVILPRVSRGVVTLKALPQPDKMDFSLLPERVVLLSCDESDLSNQVYARLAGLNWKVVRLMKKNGFGSSLASEGKESSIVWLSSYSEMDIQQALNEVDTQYGKIGIFIHLHPYNNQIASPSIFSAQSQDIVKSVFLMAKYLKTTLTQYAESNRAVFMTVARMDGEFGMLEGSNFDPMGGGLSGLVKTLNQEWSQVYCKALDIDPHIDPETASQFVMAEMFDPNRLIADVGYGDRGRVTPVVEGM